MSLFSSKKTGVRFGVVIEIGSGSVLVSIVRSSPTEKHPNIVWAKREYAPQRTDSDTNTSAKNVMAALMNAILLVASEGTGKLNATYPGSTIGHLQVSITAPWSYTITKVISYSEEKDFVITAPLLQSLMDAALKKITEELKENELATNLGLTIMTRATTDIQANDYKITDAAGKKASTLTLTQVSAVTQTYLTDAIADIKVKILPRASIEHYSFMLMFHCIIRDLHHDLTEYCLIDITYEATEIGIVRGGILRYCTHAPVGVSTLARSLAKILDIPIAEAHGFFKEPNFTHQFESLSAEKKAAVEIIFDEYQKNVANLFSETGDVLSIPKILFLHGSNQTEQFLTTQMTAAAKRATNSIHTVHPVTNELLTSAYSPEETKQLLTDTPDTAMIVAAQFFHKQHHCNDFIQV